MRDKTEDGNHVNLDQFMEDLKTVVKDGQQLLKAGLGGARERARSGAERAGVYARQKPYQTLGIAFGLGLLAGLLATGLMRSESQEEDED